MRRELHIPQPSTTTQEEHINHPSTLEAISHQGDGFVCGGNPQMHTHYAFKLTFNFSFTGKAAMHWGFNCVD